MMLHFFRMSQDDDMGYFCLSMLKKIIDMPVELFFCGAESAVSGGIIFGKKFYYRCLNVMRLLSTGT